MFASRISVLKAVTRLADGKQGERKKSKQQAEFDLLRESDRSQIEDRDIWENSRMKLRFRKFPWGNWFLGGTWLGGVVWLIWAASHDLLDFKYHKVLKEYLMIFICALAGIFFLYKGKIRHTILDKKAGTLTLKKRNTCCDKRSIVSYKLKDISDVRAVQRGYKRGTVDTESYMCIIEMERYQHQDVDTSDADSFSSSGDEKEAMRTDVKEDVVRNKGSSKKVAAEDAHNETEMQTLRGDTIDTSRNSGMTFNEEVEQMKKENIKNL